MHAWFMDCHSAFSTTIHGSSLPTYSPNLNLLVLMTYTITLTSSLGIPFSRHARTITLSVDPIQSYYSVVWELLMCHGFMNTN